MSTTHEPNAETPNLSSTTDAPDDDDLSTKKDYKQQLDEAAHKARQSDAHKSVDSAPTNGVAGMVHQVMGKVAAYVPGAEHLLGKDHHKEEVETPEQGSNVSGMTEPVRNKHDVQIEEFVRDQHRSLKDGTLQ